MKWQSELRIGNVVNVDEVDVIDVDVVVVDVVVVDVVDN